MNSGLSIQQFQLPIHKYNNQIITKVNQKLLIKNDDFLQKFNFDYFQQKVAFLTFDGFVKIYDIIQTKDGQKHIFNCEFIAHQGAIKSLSWQSPSMDSIIATCGEDKTIRVFKETGKVWREIKQISDDRNPLKVKWIENELLLLVGYQEGDIEIRQGDNYQLSYSKKLFKDFIDFDLQLMQQDAILLCCGISEEDSKYIFQIQIIKLVDKDKIEFKQKFTSFLASQIYNMKIAPYINDNEIKVAGLFENKAIIIFIEYNEQLDKNIDKISDQFIELDSISWQFQWSTFGNELQIYTENGVRVYQQNIDDKFVIL